jgi:hypothetical protein
MRRNFHFPDELDFGLEIYLRGAIHFPSWEHCTEDAVMRKIKLLGILFSLILPFTSRLQAGTGPGLTDVKILESAYVGDAGSPSENLEQLRAILKSEDAPSNLIHLYEAGTLPAKLYAIIGLQLLGEHELAQSFIDDAYQFQFEFVDTLEGCILFQSQVGELLKRISEGYYLKQFA